MDRIEVKFAEGAVDATTGEFKGYGAVFGNTDSHGDVILPGAFAESLGEWSARGRLPSMKLMHGSAGNPFTGDDLPIGVWKVMREDARGLYVEGKLSGLDTDHGRRIHGLMKDGALDGLSIGYRVKAADRGIGPNQPKRTIKSAGLFEVSLVGEPSNARARVTDLKAAEIKTIRDFEDFLRDEGGFSNYAAKAIAAGGFKAADPRDEDEADLAALVRRNIATLSSKG